MKVIIEKDCHPCEATVRFATLLQECLAIFDERHHVRGVDNVNAKNPEWMIGLIEEKLQRAKATLLFLRERGSTPEGFKELKDSCLDAANLALMTFMRASGLWPATNEADRIATAEGVTPSTAVVGDKPALATLSEQTLIDLMLRVTALEAKMNAPPMLPLPFITPKPWGEVTGMLPLWPPQVLCGSSGVEYASGDFRSPPDEPPACAGGCGCGHSTD